MLLVLLTLLNSAFAQPLLFLILSSWLVQTNLYPLSLMDFSSFLSFHTRSLGETLVFLTLLIFLFMFLAMPASSIDSSLTSVFCIITLILMLIFRTTNLLSFYFFFEASLLPIFLIIIGWGYQPERLNARLNLIIYTIAASLPLLFILSTIYLNLNLISFSLLKNLFTPFFTPNTPLVAAALTLGFLVKIPIFTVHIWLPKAHVEAPVVGSIILAALLLKLGGYGLSQFSPLMINSWFLKEIIFSLRLTGGIVISFLCIRQNDLKVLIAYSSVAHISIVIARITTFSYMGLWAAYSIIVAHAFSSSGLFLGAFYLYAFSGSRALHLRKRFLSILPRFSLLWFLLCLANIGGPPTFNLLREIANFSVILNWRNFSSFFIFFIAGLAVAYSLILYSLRQHGGKNSQTRNLATLAQSSISNITLHRLFCVFFIFFLSFTIYTNIKYSSFFFNYLNYFISNCCLFSLLKRKQTTREIISFWMWILD